jgi:hypothetical protein
MAARTNGEQVMEIEAKPKRLCSEIQLFDLCDKDSCLRKDGRYCTDEKMLARFESIKEEDDPPDRYLDNDLDDLDDLDENDDDLLYEEPDMADDFDEGEEE